MQHDVSGDCGILFRALDFPIERLHLVRQNRALDTVDLGADIDGDALTFKRIAGPQNGAVVVNADGSFTYTPNTNFNGTDTFTFAANDGTVDSAPATVTITVSAVNDAATGSLVITGAANQGFALKANLSSIADVDSSPPVDQPIRYEWRADGALIVGATNAELILTRDLGGKEISVRAHFKDGLGADESIASTSVGPVLSASLAGDVRYWHGDTPLSGTVIHVLRGDPIASNRVASEVANTHSNDAGRWLVDKLDFDRFIVKPGRTVSTDDRGSISASDVLAALKLTLGRNPNPDSDGPGANLASPVSPHQMIAADATRDGQVNLEDVHAILRTAQNPVRTSAASWVFLGEEQNLSSISRNTAMPSSPPEVTASQNTISNWVGVLTGDVDGSWGTAVVVY